MPRKRLAAPVISETEKRLLDSLDRIKEGKPTDPELKKLAVLKRLRVTISAVAREANLSRTLIGHTGCKYKRARAAIIEAMNPVVQPRTAAEVINRNRDEVAALRTAVRVRDSVNAALVLRLAEVEKRAGREARKAERQAQRAIPTSNQPVSRSLLARLPDGSSDSVVPFRPDRTSSDE